MKHLHRILNSLFFTTLLTPALFTTTAAALTFETVEPAQEMVTEQEPSEEKEQEQAALSAVAEDFSWSLENGVLTISGHGDMLDYNRGYGPNGYYSIDPPWYSSRTDITTVVIKNGITSIGNYAFSGCTSLTSITIPDSVTNIGRLAFKGCTSLTSITIPYSVTSIAESVFEGCTHLTSITIPNSVISIGWNTFYGCTGLTSIVIPDSVTSIGSSAFYGCTSLTSVTLGNGVTSIGGTAFFGCTSLSFVDISDLDAWCRIDFDDSSSNPLCYGAALYVNGVKLTEVVLSDEITAIKDYAFYKLKSLTSITLPDSVTSIGDSAFYGCTGLTSVALGNSVTSIGNFAFEDCTSLTSVALGNSVTSIGGYAFNNCRFASITIPSSVTRIHGSAFHFTPLSSVYIYDLSAWCKIKFTDEFFSFHSLYLNGTRVEQLILPGGISTIAAYTFAKTSGIKSVVIPKDVKLISQSAFGGCDSITEIYYTGTADEWERVRIADNNGSLPTATVYTDYVPDAMKITFSANTTDEVSALPNETSAVGSYVLPFTVPVRSGYNFLGWSTAPNGKATYQPGDTVEICAATTFYAVWKKTLLGDIDGNDTVDIDDAILLFQHSMLPELYPISYAGNVDFNKDGTVDIDDAVLLFQYSMLPDLYPLE